MRGTGVPARSTRLRRGRHGAESRVRRESQALRERRESLGRRAKPEAASGQDTMQYFDVDYDFLLNRVTAHWAGPHRARLARQSNFGTKSNQGVMPRAESARCAGECLAEARAEQRRRRRATPDGIVTQSDLSHVTFVRSVPRERSDKEVREPRGSNLNLHPSPRTSDEAFRRGHCRVGLLLGMGRVTFHMSTYYDSRTIDKQL
mmetsp:Transcript_26259/g.66694  ORF Transcript_26259/g.66694 Transcript_26259/m.66694 type:complete len:204 (+) Transcript_26259:464-1075(+)